MKTVFAPMRRQDRAMEPAAAWELLTAGDVMIVSLWDGGRPYGVPLSYAVHEGALVFHCAREGRKAECLRAQPRVSVCVLGAPPVPFKKGMHYSTSYQSVVAAGTASEVTDEAEKTRALLALCQKYFPGDTRGAPESIRASAERTAVYRIEIETLCGKQNRNPGLDPR